jgi:hypothetical protein
MQQQFTSNRYAQCTLLFLYFFLHSSFVILNSAHAATFKLPDTGQTKCYDPVTNAELTSCTGTGQDGAYDINPMSFTDNSDGTVTDNNTGLVWQKCSIGQNNDASCSGTATILNWYLASGTYDPYYNAATLNVCGTLALAGGGWRLPSKKELMGIVDFSIASPGPTIAQGIFPNTINKAYLSSTAYAVVYPDYVWYVTFYGPSVGYFYKDVDIYYVRCVRGGQ